MKNVKTDEAKVKRLYFTLAAMAAITLLLFGALGFMNLLGVAAFCGVIFLVVIAYSVLMISHVRRHRMLLAQHADDKPEDLLYWLSMLGQDQRYFMDYLSKESITELLIVLNDMPEKDYDLQQLRYYFNYQLRV